VKPRPLFVHFQVNDISGGLLEMYNTNPTFDFMQHCGKIITWTFDNTPFKFYINNESANYFPPYSFNTMRFCKKENKFIAALLKNNETEEIQSVIGLVKQISGPKQNFYKDLPFHITTREVWGICNKTLSIVTLNKTYDFDLNSDNILEL
jgi:hypothetical protein